MSPDNSSYERVDGQGGVRKRKNDLLYFTSFGTHQVVQKHKLALRGVRISGYI